MFRLTKYYLQRYIIFKRDGLSTQWILWSSLWDRLKWGQQPAPMQGGQNFALPQATRLPTVDNVNLIIPRLWLGNFESSQDLDFLKNNRITVIVNCTKDLPFVKLPQVYKYRVPCDDNLQKAEILSMINWLDKIIPLIDQHYQKGRSILIHCAAGMQRSAIVMLSYLYQYHTHDAGKALHTIKSKRPIAFTPFMNFKYSFCQKFGDRACQNLNQNSYGMVASSPP